MRAARRVAAVVRKEFREYRRNRFILGTSVVLPALFVGIPLLQLFSLGSATPAQTLRKVASSAELLMLVVPLTLPTAIAAYSITGERDQGTLEPVLTTPIAERELLIGKAIAAAAPAVVIAYVMAAIFAAAIRIQGNQPIVATVWSPAQITAQVLFVPLLATWSTWVSVIVSTRASDVRVAQQLSTLGSLPMVGLMALFAFRVLTPSVPLAIGLALVVLAIDVLAWRLAAATFDRERLISRYGG